MQITLNVNRSNVNSIAKSVGFKKLEKMHHSKKRGFYEVKVKKHIQMAMSTLKTHANNTKCDQSKLEGRR